MSSNETQWLTYKQAADKLGVSPQAVRQKAIRGRWQRTKGNDGQARVQVPDLPYGVRTASRQASDGALLDALREHIATLKTDVERLTAELASERAELAAERTRADGTTAGLKGNIARLESDLAVERVARQADQKQQREQLAVEWAARQADQQQLAIEREGRQADQAQFATARQADRDELTAARALADKATAELVDLARRLAAITETQASAETAEAEPEPRRSTVGRAWRWFLRN
jgi:hypothetical protein